MASLLTPHLHTAGRPSQTDHRSYTTTSLNWPRPEHAISAAKARRPPDLFISGNRWASTDCCVTNDRSSYAPFQTTDPIAFRSWTRYGPRAPPQLYQTRFLRKTMLLKSCLVELYLAHGLFNKSIRPLLEYGIVDLYGHLMLQVRCLKMPLLCIIIMLDSILIFLA